MSRRVVVLLFALITIRVALSAAGDWREASAKELATVIPARAPVQRERIETEMRTAAGVTNSRGAYIAGVVLITAGYSAEGKYSHFFLTQVPIKVGDVSLDAGEYVFGYHREADALQVSFYDANSGKPLGVVQANKVDKSGAIRSFQITPPSGDKPGAKGAVMIGRFVMPYTLGK
ncbi:MAG TPA: hypothetical protein VGC88_09640 [Terriglobales bacterium]|jgi:hypothetical protein